MSSNKDTRKTPESSKGRFLVFKPKKGRMCKFCGFEIKIDKVCDEEESKSCRNKR